MAQAADRQYPTVSPMNNAYMLEARVEAWKSTDLRRPIGVVIVQAGKIVARGSNQATIRLKWIINWHRTNCVRKMLGIKGHRFYWLCPGCALYRNHAERQAIRNFKGVPKGEYTMYLHGHKRCCEPCLEHIKRFGVKEVYTYHDKI